MNEIIIKKKKKNYFMSFTLNFHFSVAFTRTYLNEFQKRYI